MVEWIVQRSTGANVDYKGQTQPKFKSSQKEFWLGPMSQLENNLKKQ